MKLHFEKDKTATNKMLLIDMSLHQHDIKLTAGSSAHFSLTHSPDNYFIYLRMTLGSDGVEGVHTCEFMFSGTLKLNTESSFPFKNTHMSQLMFTESLD